VRPRSADAAAGGAVAPASAFGPRSIRRLLVDDGHDQPCRPAAGGGGLSPLLPVPTALFAIRFMHVREVGKAMISKMHLSVDSSKN
jgi:hypothetical protein